MLRKVFIILSLILVPFSFFVSAKSDSVIYGKTLEQGGGDKSPNNPYVLTGYLPDEFVYSGNVYDIPFSEPLYGNGVLNDEYDVATGVEIRRWKRLILDGSEEMRCEAHGNGQLYISLDLSISADKSIFPVSTHYISSVWTQENNRVYIPSPVVMVITDSRFTSLQVSRDILADCYASGKPVTVLYPLAEPIVIQHEPVVLRKYLSTIPDFLSEIGGVFSGFIGWIGSMLVFFTGNPVVFIPLLMFFLVGGVIGILMRILKN